MNYIPRPIGERFREAVNYGSVKIISGDLYLISHGLVFRIGEQTGKGVVLHTISAPYNVKLAEDKLIYLCKEAGIEVMHKFIDTSWRYLTSRPTNN
jgi:hypothetical protein